METISKQLMQRATEEGKLPLPYLQLAEQIKDEDGNKKGVKGTGPHKVELVLDKIVKGQDYQTKEERDEVEFTFIEDDQKKRYSVPVHNKKGGLHYFVQRMSEIEVGEEIILEYQKKEGSFEGYIDIKKVGKEVNKEADKEEIPVVDEESYGL